MIYGRPELRKDMGRGRFLEFYYLESEMAEFCEKNGLDSIGSRNELKDRIAAFMGGTKFSEAKFVLKQEVDSNVITEETPIEKGLTFSDKHSRFFEDSIGTEFVAYEEFIIWLEESAGKTYGDAVNFWYYLHDDLVSG